MKAWFFILLFLTASSAIANAVDVDIRNLAPAQPEIQQSRIARPEAGATLGEIGGDWARRQIHLSTNGADEQFLADTNESLDRFFGFADDPTLTGRGPASAAPEQSNSWIKPRSLHLSKVGEFELAFSSDLRLHCDLLNGNDLTLSKPIFQDIDLRLHHENTLNSLQLKFGW